MSGGIIGHDEGFAAFRDALATGRMHHAWLIAGPRGIGKAGFAGALALDYLANGDPAQRAAAEKLLQAGSHPDFARLERLRKDGAGEERARNISVDQVRGLGRLFATGGSYSSRRVVLIDAADDLERNAANALLKALEEPPAEVLFLLVSHAPGRLLPTIRSRCRLLRLSPLDDDGAATVLRRTLPEAEEDEIATLVRLGEGAPGRAIAYAGLDVPGLERAMAALARTGDPTIAERGALAKSLAAKSAQPRYELFLRLAPAFIAEAAKARRGQALADAIALWERARDLADVAPRLSLDAQTTVFELAGMIAALAPEAAAAKA